VYLTSITWAYRVPANYQFNGAPQVVSIYGIHRTPRAEVLLCKIGEEHFQPLEPTRPLHLTLSTEPGVPPAEADQIDMSTATLFPQPLLFIGRLALYPAVENGPQANGGGGMTQPDPKEGNGLSDALGEAFALVLIVWVGTKMLAFYVPYLLLAGLVSCVVL